MEEKKKLETLQKEYKIMVEELKVLKEKYKEINEEYKETNKKIIETNDKIEDIEEEIINMINSLSSSEKKYIETKQLKILQIVLIISAVIGLTFGRYPLFDESGAINILINALLTSFVYSGVAGVIFGAGILESNKIIKILKEKYSQTEHYIKSKEEIKQKEKSISELKIKQQSQISACEKFRVVYNLNDEIKRREQEIEEFKQTVFMMLFENEKYNEQEKTTPLVKIRKNPEIK